MRVTFIMHARNVLGHTYSITDTPLKRCLRMRKHTRKCIHRSRTNHTFCSANAFLCGAYVPTHAKCSWTKVSFNSQSTYTQTYGRQSFAILRNVHYEFSSNTFAARANLPDLDACHAVRTDRSKCVNARSNRRHRHSQCRCRLRRLLRQCHCCRCPSRQRHALRRRRRCRSASSAVAARTRSQRATSQWCFWPGHSLPHPDDVRKQITFAFKNTTETRRMRLEGTRDRGDEDDGELQHIGSAFNIQHSTLNVGGICHDAPWRPRAPPPVGNRRGVRRGRRARKHTRWVRMYSAPPSPSPPAWRTNQFVCRKNAF